MKLNHTLKYLLSLTMTAAIITSLPACARSNAGDTAVTSSSSGSISESTSSSDSSSNVDSASVASSDSNSSSSSSSSDLGSSSTDDTNYSIAPIIKDITSMPRGAGLATEATSIDNAIKFFTNLGFEVKEDPFTAYTRLGEEFNSRNIVAIKHAGTTSKSSSDGSGSEAAATTESPDVLVLSAHIDSIPSTVGAIDDGSGVAVLEDVAAQIADTDSDTELWFCIFSGEEEGLLGSSHFTSTISDEDKSRIIGDVQVDMVGHYLTEGYDVDTSNGYANMVSDLLSTAIKDVTGKQVSVTQEKSSDHISFTIAGIPSVMLTQNGDGFENHEINDDLSMVDMSKLQQASDIIKSLVEDVMSDTTKDMASKSKSMQTIENTAGYLSPQDEIFDIDTTFHGMQDNLGVGFTYVGNDPNEAKEQSGIYTAPVFWLNMDTPIETEFKFLKGEFSHCYVKAYDAGISLDEIKKLLTTFAGEGVPSQDKAGRLFYAYLKGRTGFQLDVNSDGSYRLMVTPYSLGNEELSSIMLNVSDSNLSNQEKQIYDELIAKIIPQDMMEKYMDRVVIYTDGVSYTLGFTDPAEPDSEKNAMWLDINDIFNEDGSYRHYYKTVATIIHEFGHVIGMNYDQLDVAANGTDSFSLPPYRDNSYMKKFVADFYPDQDVNDRHLNENHTFRQHPDEYVSLYASDKLMEDFAESFRCYVLMDKQKGDTVAEKKINFFYDYPELVEIRDFIRGNFEFLK